MDRHVVTLIHVKENTRLINSILVMLLTVDMLLTMVVVGNINCLTN